MTKRSWQNKIHPNLQDGNTAALREPKENEIRMLIDFFLDDFYYKQTKNKN